jgi:chromosome segregation ATPase
MNIQGGALEFEALWDSGAIERGLKTTEQLVKNFTSLTVKGGADIDAEYKKVAAGIKAGFEAINNSIKNERDEIEKLSKEYDKLGQKAEAIKNQGSIKSSDYRSLLNITQQQADIEKEISGRKQVVKEYEQEDKALQKLNSRLENYKDKIDNASNGQVRFRTQLLNVKNEMMQLEQAGKKNTADYARLVEEAK